eukprot:2295472-Rhodomonas_salina.9
MAYHAGDLGRGELEGVPELHPLHGVLDKLLVPLQLCPPSARSAPASRHALHRITARAKPASALHLRRGRVDLGPAVEIDLDRVALRHRLHRLSWEDGVEVRLLAVAWSCKTEQVSTKQSKSVQNSASAQ